MAGVIYVMCTSVGRAILKAHLNHHKDIPIVRVYNLDQEQGKSKSNYDDLYDISSKHNLDINYIRNINSPDVISEISDLSPDLIVQSGWSQKFSDKVLSLPRFGCIGEHPSPIPIGKGAATVNWAIINGEKQWGDSFFIMNDKYDDGPLIYQNHFLINPHEDVSDVYRKVAISSYSTIRDCMGDWYQGVFNIIETNGARETYFKRRTPNDGLIHESMTIDEIERLVLAVSHPYPGARIDAGRHQIKIWSVKRTSGYLGELESLFGSNTLFKCRGSLFLKGACGGVVEITEFEGDHFPTIQNVDLKEGTISLEETILAM